MARESLRYLGDTEKLAQRLGFAPIPKTTVRPRPLIMSHVRPDIVKALMEAPQRTPIPQTINISDPGFDPVMQEYQEAIGQSYVGPLNIGWVYELARFRVLPNSVGIVKHMWCYVDQDDQEIPTTELSDRNGGGTTFDPFSIVKSGLNVRYRLQLWQKPASQADPAFFAGPLGNMPGTTYTKQPPWTDNRFPWGIPNPVHFVIPGGFYLRLFLETVDATARNVANLAGRMWGFTQPRGREETSRAVREGWR